MVYKFQNLVFEGGGVKGVAYLGALKVLSEEKNILSQITRVGGTSAGAINAVLVGLGYSIEETDKTIRALNFKNFMDDSWGVVRDTSRLIEKFGWYKGDFFRSWIGQIIKQKTGNSESTFADIEAMKVDRGFKSMYFMGTNLTTRFSEVFSFEHTPRVCIADAVRISMSIPLFFAAIRNFRDDVYVDGGVLDNFPIKLFDREKYLSQASNSSLPDYYQKVNAQISAKDRSISNYVYNKETLGFRLDSKEEIAMFRDQAEPKHHEIKDIFDYSWSLVSTLIEAQQNYHLHSDDWARTIYIDTLGVGTTDFDLSDKTKQDLINSGIDATRKYFTWYDSADPAPNK
jgi:NTE family protein